MGEGIIVSIPDRDFRVFQPAGLAQVEAEFIKVSIPDRDFRVFQLQERKRIQDTINKVSIPDRDFRVFQQLKLDFPQVGCCVSIPDRDFRVFQLPSPQRLSVFSFQGSVTSMCSHISTSRLGVVKRVGEILAEIT